MNIHVIFHHSHSTLVGGVLGHTDTQTEMDDSLLKIMV